MAKPLGYLILGLFVLTVAFLSFGSRPSSPEKARERDAIALCRDQQNDELKELSERRFIRATCDKMSADFRAKWGVNP